LRRVLVILMAIFSLQVVAAEDGDRAKAASAMDVSVNCARGAASNGVVHVRTTLAGVPAIVRVPPLVTKPPVILWHGFGPPASESALMEALPLDEVLAIKVYLGLPLFGQRAPAADVDSVQRRQAEDYALRLFEPAVLGAAKELQGVVKALEKSQCIGPKESIGLFGFSAGGAAVLLALAERDVPVGAAVIVNAPTGLNASIDALERATKRPYAWTPAARKLAERSDSVRRASEIGGASPPVALLLFHGADDTVVTSRGAVALQGALLPVYERAGASERLKLVIAPHVSHDWSDPRTVEGLRVSVAEWFNRHL
jgi:alpha-beta hydrolase superfamily lysophospholipase